MMIRLLSAALIAFGGWQFGQGAYLLAKAELAQWLLEQAWNEMQGQVAAAAQPNQPVQPWLWADTWPMAKMHWPQLQKKLIVLEGGSGRNLAFGPAHLSASVLPGQPGISVIGGHRDTHFEFLQHVLIGDEFFIETLEGQFYGFQVKEIVIADVRESDIVLDSSVAKIALVACYPFSNEQAGGHLRYLVLAELKSSSFAENPEKLEQVPPTFPKMMATMGV